MNFNIAMKNDFTGERFGLHFVHGLAKTTNAFLASRLKAKGYSVTVEDAVMDGFVTEENSILQTNTDENFTGQIELDEILTPQSDMEELLEEVPKSKSKSKVKSEG